MAHYIAKRSWRAVLLLTSGAPLLAGCPFAGTYRTARTLNRGEIDIGAMVSGTHVEIPEVTVADSQGGSATVKPGLSVTYPNLTPEVNVHYGITDDFEFGGRFALSALMLEADLKLRLVGSRESATNVAIAPAAGYQTFLILEGPHATLPLIFTQDLRDDISLNLAGYVGYRNLHATAGSDTGSNWDRFAVSAATAGGSVGVEFHGSRIHVMPMLDIARTVSTLSESGSSTTASATQTYIVVGLVFGAIVNRPLPGAAPAPGAAAP